MTCHATPEQAKALLDNIAPGKWEFRQDVADLPNGTQEIGHTVRANNAVLFECWDDTVTMYPGNLPLAAAAPELAQTVAAMHHEYEVQVRYHDHEVVGSEWYPCDANAMTHIDHCDGGKPWRWVAPKTWDTLESAEETAEALRTFEDRDVRIVGRLVSSLGVVG